MYTFLSLRTINKENINIKCSIDKKIVYLFYQTVLK